MTHTIRTTRHLGRLMIGASLVVATSMTAGTLLPLGADDGTDARPSEIDGIPDLAEVPAEVLAALAGSAFSQLTPARLVDTRKGTNPRKFGELDGTGTPMEITITNGRTFDDKATGLPASGISAVALNITVVDGQTNDYGGYITVYPCGTRPDASNLNYVTGQTVPNAVIAPVSADGKICIHNYGTAHLLVDVSGYFGN